MATSEKETQDRSAAERGDLVDNQRAPQPSVPAAGAHAAGHLTNEDAAPGSGALPSRVHAAGKEVDGGAG